VEGEGSVAKDPNKNRYTDGDEVELTARPASGWSFKEWKGALSGSDNPKTVTMDEDKNVTAVFVEDAARSIRLRYVWKEKAPLPEDPDRSSYTDGEEVELTAQPASGWSFKEWKGALSGSDNPKTVTMDADKSVTAVFVEDAAEEYTLTVRVEGEGSVSRNPDKSSYTDGEEVELTARPASGWSFREWKGALSGSNNPETIVMDQTSPLRQSLNRTQSWKLS
jgi:hypothetical protein